MSGNNQDEKDGQPAPRKTRKTIVRRLEMGQNISMTPQDDRMIRMCFEYITGFIKRNNLQQQIDKKKMELSTIAAASPHINTAAMDKREEVVPRDIDDDDHEDGETTYGHSVGNRTPADQGSGVHEEDSKVQSYRRIKSELFTLEDSLVAHLALDHKITIKDLDAVLKRKYGVTMSKRDLEVREQLAKSEIDIMMIFTLNSMLLFAAFKIDMT